MHTQAVLSGGAGYPTLALRIAAVVPAWSCAGEPPVEHQMTRMARALARSALLIWFVSISLSMGLAQAQNAHSDSKTVAARTHTVFALMVSDIHFEPFWDPAKAAQLELAQAGSWDAILTGPPSADRRQRFDALQEKCHARGVDTPYALYKSSLGAIHAKAGEAGFAIVSGDLVAHAFSCKYSTLFPQATPQAYSAFVVKTLDYVLHELHKTLPGVPIYAALGNNDSGCGDYQLDANSEFLRAAATVFTEGFPAAEREKALVSFGAGGNYSIALPAPVEHTRLLVLDDLFQSRRYSTCDGRPDAAAGTAEIAWLRSELDRAREHKEKVWVMGHIPPGIDPFTTILKMRNVCGGKSPDEFLASDELGKTIGGFGDVVRLAIFAHTHMDELRLLKPSGTGTLQSAQAGVAIKLVPSISPINGNSPSFTVAQIDPTTAVMEDYKVFAASNSTGVDAEWTRAYDFAEAFHVPDFSAASVGKLIGEFAADPNVQTEASQSYIRNYYVRDVSAQIKAFWPQYSCALSNLTAESYRSCVCSPAH
jgi:sphingomyelin phosphodiesterase acid-like 3